VTKVPSISGLICQILGIFRSLYDAPAIDNFCGVAYTCNKNGNLTYDGQYTYIYKIGTFLKEESTKLAGTETVIGGRKVKTILRPLPQEKEKTTRQSVLKVIFNHLRRKKGK
jgi:hypothetical protein